MWFLSEVDISKAISTQILSNSNEVKIMMFALFSSFDKLISKLSSIRRFIYRLSFYKFDNKISEEIISISEYIHARIFV